VAAQNNTGAPAPTTFSFEMLHPTFDDDRSSVTSGAYFLGLARQLSPQVSLALELPFARMSRDEDGRATGSSTIGNPYVGIAITNNANARVDVGVRIPLAADDEIASFYGALADQNRLEAFMPKLIAYRVSGALTTRAAPVRGTVSFGPTVFYATDSEVGDRWEVLLDYGGRVTASAGALQLSTGVEGRYGVTTDGGFAERSENQAVLTASYAFGVVRPGVQVRLPLDDETRAYMNGSFGVLLLVGLL
jgi:hypothetical protein